MSTAGHFDRSIFTSNDQNNGQQSDITKLENINAGLADQIDANYDYTSGLVAGGVLQPYPAFLSRQALINGNFDVWQRGTSFSGSGLTAYTADRWKVNRIGGGTTTVSQDTVVPSNGKSRYSLKVVGAYANLEYQDIKYHIESADSKKFSGQKVTVSLQHQESVSAGSTIAQIIVTYPSVADNFSTVETISSKYLTVSAAFIQESLTLTLPSASPLNAYPIGNGIQIIIRYTQQTATGTLTANISQVQVNTGDQALSFQPRSFAEELALCQRYYEKSYDYSVAPGTASNATGIETKVVPSNTVATSQPYGRVSYKVKKRTTTTVTIYPFATPTNTGRVSDNNGLDLAANSGSVASSGDSGFNIQNGSGGALTTVSNVVIFHWAADAET